MEVLITVMALWRRMGGMQKKLIIPTTRHVNLGNFVVTANLVNHVDTTHRYVFDGIFTLDSAMGRESNHFGVYRATWMDCATSAPRGTENITCIVYSYAQGPVRYPSLRGGEQKVTEILERKGHDWCLLPLSVLKPFQHVYIGIVQHCCHFPMRTKHV